MIKTGIDIVDIRRMEKMSENPKFVRKIFTESELKDHDSGRLASIFALKEAFFKATQAKIKEWNELSVRLSENGSADIVFEESKIDLGIKKIESSFSFDGDYAIATVLIEHTKTSDDP